MSEEINLSNIQRRIMDLAAEGLSWGEISDDINNVLSPKEVERRVRKYLAEASQQYNPIEQRAMLVYKINKLHNKLYSMLDGFDGLKAAGPLAKLLDNMESMLKMELPNIEEHMRLLTKAQAVLVVESLSLSNERAILEYSRSHPEFDEAQFREYIAQALPMVTERLNSRAAIEQ